MAWRDDLAGDILQEAILTAWREFPRFEPSTNFRAWLFRILTNTIYRLNKKVGREVSIEENHLDPRETMEREDTWGWLLEDPDQLMQLLDDRLIEALKRLGTDERQCLLLRSLEEFSYKEIAEMLAISLGTVMSHIHRGRIKLRESLTGLALEQGYLKRAKI